ncbi:MAG TPA: hypothetical protein VEC38_10730 [Candidatus Binataceae bacterium]|nr:hypothetical protein [Candidatus Binataceae bacterium]
MNPRIWLRVAAVLQALGIVGHTIASSKTTGRGPQEQAVFDAMRAFHFQIMGSSRTYWDFMRGYAHSTTVFFAIMAVLMWQLGNLGRTNAREARPFIIVLFVGQAFLVVLSWTYFFAGPGVVATAIALCLGIASIAVSRAG